MATHYCTTHLFNAAVPMHKVSQKMQHTIPSSKKRKSRLEPSIALRAQSEVDSPLDPPAAQASLLSSAAKAPFTRKNTMFRANPNVQIASVMCEDEAFVRCFLQFSKVQDLKTKTSCDDSLQFQELKMWKRSFRAMISWHSKSWRCEHTSSTQQLHCAKCLKRCKTQ